MSYTHTVVNNGDNGIGVTGLMSGAGPNLIANNTLTNNGRFGIEIKLPNGTGATSGDGSIVVENNTVSRTNPIGSEVRDLAGIAVFRRAFVIGNNNVDVPTGVVVRNNTVSGYQQPSDSDGFGIVIEGTNHTVTGNTVSNNDVGIQQQAGHLPYTANSTQDGDQSNLADQYFGRGNSPVACGNTVSGNTLSGNTTDTRNVGPGVGRSETVRNINTGVIFCTIQSAVDAASAGQSISASAGTFPEDVSVTKSLTISGAGLTSSTVIGPIGGAGTTFQIGASNVLLEGFYITREGNNTTDWNGSLNTAGLSVQGQAITGFEVRNSRFEGNRTAIDVNNNNGSYIHNNIITNNRTGLVFRNQTDNTRVEENEVTNNWTVGVLFLDASGGTNVPVQQALNSNFNNNNISGNWYGQIVDRQVGGSLPAPGTNLKNFQCNWYGTATPVVSTTNSSEPGYSAQIPTTYGGSATPPGGQADILGQASGNFVFTPFLTNGTDNNLSTTGFQPVPNSCSCPPPTVALSSTNTCAGGTVSLSATAGFGTSYTFVNSSNAVIGTGANTTTVSVLTAGIFNYSVIVAGTYGCTASAGTSVTVEPQPTLGTVTIDPVCEGSPASVTLTGLLISTQQSLSYVIGTGASRTATVTSDVSGRAVFVTDVPITAADASQPLTVTAIILTNTGCGQVFNIGTTLQVNPVTALSLGATGSNTITCNNLVTLTATSGLSSYTFTGPGMIVASGNSATVNQGGSYSVVGTASNGCPTTVATTTVLSDTAASSVALSGTNVCAGLPIPLSATAGLSSYTFVAPSPGVVTPSGNRATVTGLTTSGTYTFTVLVTAANGCTTSAARSVTVNGNPTVTASNNSPLCAPTDLGNPNLTLSSSATGTSLTYLWSGPISVPNNGGFGANLPNGINTPNRILLAIGPSASGIYTVVVTSGQGCTVSATTSVTVHRSPTPSLTATSFCLQAQPVLTAGVTNTNPGDNLLYELALNGTVISTSTTTATSLTYAVAASGTYSLSITNLTVGNCRRSPLPVIILPGPAAPIISNTSAQLTACAGTAISITAVCPGAVAVVTPIVPIVSGFASSTGSSGATGRHIFTTPSTAGVYAYSVICRNTLTGCLSTTYTPVSATVNARPTISSLASTSINCLGNTLGSFTVVASGTSPFTFSANGQTNNTGIFTSLTAGTYPISLTDATGCSPSSVTSVTINQPASFPGVTITPSATAVCTGTTVNLTATASGGTGTLTYTWFGGTSPTNTSVVTAANTLGASSYTVTVSDANGCTATQTASVTVTAFPVVTLSGQPSTTLSCAQPSATLVAGGGTTYVFTDNVGTPIPSSGNQAVVSAQGTYSVIATNNGCSSTTSIVISQNNVVSSVSMGNPAASSAVCVGGSVSVPVGVTNATGLQWYKDGIIVPGQTSATLTLGGVQPSQAGNYRLVATGVCNSLTTIPGFTLTVNPQPTVTLVFNNSATVMGMGIPTITVPPGSGQSFQVFGGTSFERKIVVDKVDTYLITQVDNNGTGIFEINRLGLFTLTVTDGNGCSRTVQGIIRNP